MVSMTREEALKIAEDTIAEVLRSGRIHEEMAKLGIKATTAELAVHAFVASRKLADKILEDASGGAAP